MAGRSGSGRAPGIVDQEADAGVDRRTHQVVVSVLRRHAQTEGRPTRFTMLGLDWDLMDEVFAPIYTPSTELYSTWMPFPVGGAFLEVGCGAGVTAVLAALRGCSTVTALDISAAAVANTQRNSVAHGMSHRIRVLQSDMFAALDAEARFDVIFWNSNYAHAPSSFVYETQLQHAFFDAGYRSHSTYLKEGPSHLSDGGRLLLGFSNLGDRRHLDRLASRAGLRVELVQHTSVATSTIDYQLLELVALR
jgi:release factor glutamine methyltransferase